MHWLWLIVVIVVIPLAWVGLSACVACDSYDPYSDPGEKDPPGSHSTG